MMTMLIKMDVRASRGQMKALPYIRQSLCDNLRMGGGGGAGCLKVVYTVQRPLQGQTETRT